MNVEQALSLMSLYTATSTTTTVSYIYISGPPLLILTFSSNTSIVVQLHRACWCWIIRANRSRYTNSLSCTDTHEPFISLTINNSHNQWKSLWNTYWQYAASLFEINLTVILNNPPISNVYGIHFLQSFCLNPNLNGL